MTYLTYQQVLALHHQVIQKTGGSHGVRDIGLLHSAVARPKATFDGDELYSTLFTKAAALFESLARNHPFVDGNKRTAVAAAGLLLRLNERRLLTSNEELVEYALNVVVENPGIDAIATWLEKNSRPYHG